MSALACLSLAHSHLFTYTKISWDMDEGRFKHQEFSRAVSTLRVVNSVWSWIKSWCSSRWPMMLWKTRRSRSRWGEEPSPTTKMVFVSAPICRDCLTNLLGLIRSFKRALIFSHGNTHKLPLHNVTGSLMLRHQESSCLSSSHQQIELARWLMLIVKEREKWWERRVIFLRSYLWDEDIK